MIDEAVPMEMNRAIFAIVDTLQLPLVKSGPALTGHETKKLQYGNLEIDFPVRVSSDFMKDGQVGVLVHLRKNLWGYVYSDGRGKPFKLWMAMFDGKDKNFGSLKTYSSKKFLDDHRSDIKAAFLYKDEGWKQIDPSELS